MRLKDIKECGRINVLKDHKHILSYYRDANGNITPLDESNIEIYESVKDDIILKLWRTPGTDGTNLEVNTIL